MCNVLILVKEKKYIDGHPHLIIVDPEKRGKIFRKIGFEICKKKSL